MLVLDRQPFDKNHYNPDDGWVYSFPPENVDARGGNYG